MRSRERLAETLRSINVPVFEQQVLADYPEGGWAAYFDGIASLVENENTDGVAVAELYLIKSTSPHYEDLITEARLHLGGMPF